MPISRHELIKPESASELDAMLLAALGRTTVTITTHEQRDMPPPAEETTEFWIGMAKFGPDGSRMYLGETAAGAAVAINLTPDPNGKAGTLQPFIDIITSDVQATNA
jgi:hypothetical protein